MHTDNLPFLCAHYAYICVNVNLSEKSENKQVYAYRWGKNKCESMDIWWKKGEGEGFVGNSLPV